MKNKQHKVLVLGSSGLIGSELVKTLRQKSCEVEEYDIKNCPSQDLTNPKYLPQLQNSVKKADFVYFLAFDVGGSKYLANNQQSHKFISNNMGMMINVFDTISTNKTPFLFTSSMMALMPWSTYGKLKSLGEDYTKTLGGVSVRFWNVYGHESLSEKSHVISDFCWQAANKGKIQILSTGNEVRQFIHVSDAVTAMETLREKLPAAQLNSKKAPVYDISDGHWIKILDVAKQVSKEFGGVPIVLGDLKDQVQKNSRKEPNLKHIISNPFNWKRKTTLTQGVRMVAGEYKNA